ncbi:MAG: RidA family protein [Nitrospirae bacterium]|nr:RidA family protein [Nitrospirota bacterium]
MFIEEKLKMLGIELPSVPKPVGSYVSLLQAGSLLFLSGLLPVIEGTLKYRGRVVSEVSIEEAEDAARIIVINALSIVKAALGDLDRVERCVKLTGYVASDNTFTEQPRVLNAASNLLVDIFGEKGKHTRAAIGVSVLPLNAPLEIEFIFEVG